MRRTAHSRYLTLAALSFVAALSGTAAATHQPLAPPLCDTEGAGAPSDDGTLRVANYNILHGTTEEPPAYPAHSTLDERLKLSAKQIAAAGVDVVGLQEVSDTLANDLTQHLPGNVAQRLAARLAKLTEQKWYWCWYLANPHFPGEPDLQPGGGGPLSDILAAAAFENYASFKEGAAVVSRYPILDAEGRRLPSRLPVEHVLCVPDVPGCNLVVLFESRVALWADIETPGGDTHIVTTHLSNDVTAGSDLSVLAQTAAVLAFADEKAAADPPARRYFTCDCNVKETDPVPVIPAITAAGWTDVFRSLHPADPGYTAGLDVIVTTTATREMTERIDYVFWRAGSCATAPGAAAIFLDQPKPGRTYLWPSDHLGVHTDVATAGCL